MADCPLRVRVQCCCTSHPTRTYAVPLGRRAEGWTVQDLLLDLRVMRRVSCTAPEVVLDLEVDTASGPARLHRSDPLASVVFADEVLRVVPASAPGEGRRAAEPKAVVDPYLPWDAGGDTAREAEAEALTGRSRRSASPPAKAATGPGQPPAGGCLQPSTARHAAATGAATACELDKPVTLWVDAKDEVQELRQEEACAVSADPYLEPGTGEAAATGGGPAPLSEPGPAPGASAAARRALKERLPPREPQAQQRAPAKRHRAEGQVAAAAGGAAAAAVADAAGAAPLAAAAAGGGSAASGQAAAPRARGRAGRSRCRRRS